MDPAARARSLFVAALPAAAWVSVLETGTLALRADVPSSALAPLALTTFGLSGVGAWLMAVVLWGAAFVPGAARVADVVAARPSLGRSLLAASLVLSLVAHYVNARYYVRLYAGAHAVLGCFTLLTALLAFASLPGAYAARTNVATWLALLGTFAALSIGVPWVVTSEVLRAAALEQGTLLDDELRIFDRISGIFATAAASAVVPIDPELRAALAPRPVDSPSGSMRGANVVLVTIDSLRADRWLAGGAREVQLPALEALGAAGARFTHAYAPSCWTLHSMSAVLFDRLPSQLRFTPLRVGSGLHFSTAEADAVDPADPRTFKRYTPAPWGAQPPGFVTALRSAGYETATVAAYVFYFREAGLTAPFEHVDEAAFRELTIDGAGVAPVPMVERAERLLDDRDPGRPFFLWLHFMEPHAPYDARDPQAQGAAPSVRYDSELRYVDTQLGALRAELVGRGLDANTLWVVHADHGEEFGDHGGEFHATTLYEETVRVPLLLRPPATSGFAPRSIDAPVSLLDLGPTLLDALGVATSQPLLGRSLLPLMRGEAQTARPVLMECDRFAARKRGYLRWPFKLIVDRSTSTSQLFALSRDPREQQNLASREPALLEAMQTELRQIEALLGH